MQQVIVMAEKLLEQGLEVPVAAIISKDDKIISTGLNAREAQNKSVIAHAEIQAIEAAAQELQDWNLSDCTLYVNLEPCVMCTGAILQSHISTVVFGAYDSKAGALGSRYNLSNKKLNIVGGILENESIKLLQDFFKKLRP